MVSENLKEFIGNFNEISKRGWIKGVKRGTGSVGLTFEYELHKLPDYLYFPDYNGVEIKCTTRFSRFPFSLFSLAFEGPTFPEINRIIDLYGYGDYKYRNKKVLKVDVNTISLKKSGNFKFKLYLDKGEEKLFLEVYDLNDGLIERKSFVYVDTIVSHLNFKLKKLAIIYGSKKVINEDLYFRYYKLEGYELKNGVFMNLLEEGKIFATLESRIGKSGIFDGKYKNKNLVFKIQRQYLEELFSKKVSVDNDYGINKLTSSKNCNFYIMR